MYVSVWGKCSVVPAANQPTAEVGGEPPDGVVVEGGVSEGSEEFVVVDRVEGLR